MHGRHAALDVLQASPELIAPQEPQPEDDGEAGGEGDAGAEGGASNAAPAVRGVRAIHPDEYPLGSWPGRPEARPIGRGLYFGRAQRMAELGRLA